MLEQRRLGSQGLTVSVLGLGCMGMSQSYGLPDDAESIATIHRALELGVTLFDTAEAYGPYTNEELLGRALKGRRSQAVIATKFGFRLEGNTLTGVDSRPEHIKDVAEASLRRLGRITSICSTSIGSIPPSRSRTSSAQWRIWSAKGRCSFLVCPKRASRPSAGHMRYIPFQRCRASTHSGSETWNRTSFRCSESSASGWWHSVRWDAVS